MIDQEHERKSARLLTSFKWLALASLVVGLGFSWRTEKTANAQLRSHLYGAQLRNAIDSSSNLAKDEGELPAGNSPATTRPSLQIADASDAEVLRTENTGYRPVTEMRTESYRVSIPYVDPKTGERKFRWEERTRTFPVQRWIPFNQWNPELHSQIEAIQAMKDNDLERPKAIEKLRKLLDDEFSKTHDQQAIEIADTEKRLAKLKQTHEKRGANKDKIVQRRIDQLLGQPDDLAWVPEQVQSETPNAIHPVPSWPKADSEHWRLADPGGRSPSPPQTFAPVVEPGLSTTVAPVIPPRPSNPPVDRSDFEPSKLSNRFEPQAGTPTLKDLFDLARKATAAVSKHRNFAADLKESEQGRGEETMSPRDLRRAEIKLQELAQEVELYERQIEATERRLSGDLAFAEKSLQNLFHRMNLQKENLSDDPASKQKLLEITKEREQLEKMEFDAMSNLDQFKIIMKDFLNDSAAKQSDAEPEGPGVPAEAK